MRLKNKYKGLLLSTALVSILLPVQAVRAADENEDAKKPTPVEEEVFVYARKRVERPIEVPVSLDFYTASDLEDSGVENIDDLALFIPGFSFEKTFGRQLDRPVLRGMSTILSGTQIEQNVGFYVDGVFVSGAISATTFQNLERIEVLRGPQNALYGRSAFAGAINFITKKPTDEFEGNINLTAATHDEFSIGLNLSGPIVPEKLRYYFGASHYQYGGEYQNTFTNRTIGGENTETFTGALYFTPTTNFDATLKVTYANDDDEHVPQILQDSTFNNCFLETDDQYYCGEVVEFPSVALNTPSVAGGGLWRETWRTSLTTNTKFSGHTLTTITAYNDEQLEAGLDLDGTSNEPIEFFPFCPGFECLKGSFQTHDMTVFKDFSQEVRVTSPGERRFRWLTGVYYFHREHSGQNFLPRAGLKAVTKTKTFALFGQAQYDFSDLVTGTVDLRYSHDKKTLLLPDATFLTETYSSINPRFTVDYAPTENRLYYITVAKGTKPGGFNPRTQLPPELLTFEQEKAWNFEAGTKFEIPDAGGFVQIAAYYVNWSNQQLTSSFETGMGRPIIYTVNAGKTRVLGLEVSARFRPVYAWEVAFTYAYNDAEFRVYDVEEQEDLTGDPSVAGNKTPRAPRNMATFTTVYRKPVTSAGDLFVRGDVLYESKRYAQVHNLAHTGDKVILNLRLGFESENMTVSLYAKNLLDDRSAVSVTRYRDFAGYDSFTAPRAFILTLPRGRQFGLAFSQNF